MAHTSSRRWLERRRHDPGEIRRLLSRRESEGLSYAQLSADSGIPVGTLAWWGHQLRSESRVTTAATEFVEVIPKVSAEASGDVEITLPSGIQVHAPGSIDREALARLVTAILTC